VFDGRQGAAVGIHRQQQRHQHHPNGSQQHVLTPAFAAPAAVLLSGPPARITVKYAEQQHLVAAAIEQTHVPQHPLPSSPQHTSNHKRQQQQQQQQEQERRPSKTEWQQQHPEQQQQQQPWQHKPQENSNSSGGGGGGRSFQEFRQLLRSQSSSAVIDAPLLTAAIKACCTCQEAAQLFLEHSASFNHIHTAALVSQLAKVRYGSTIHTACCTASSSRLTWLAAAKTAAATCAMQAGELIMQ
jgi:hypothetical protein